MVSLLGPVLLTNLGFSIAFQVYDLSLVPCLQPYLHSILTHPLDDIIVTTRFLFKVDMATTQCFVPLVSFYWWCYVMAYSVLVRMKPPIRCASNFNSR